MRLITCHGGKIHTTSADAMRAGRAGVFSFGLTALDRLMPTGLARGSVHEILAAEGSGMTFAVVLAKAATSGGEDGGRGDFKFEISDLGFEIKNQKSKIKNPLPLVWCDPHLTLYPPALAAMGIDLGRVLMVRPGNEADHVWAVAECLRCRGGGATVAGVGTLSRIGARKLQLAAEAGGGVGVLMRPAEMAGENAAATRWLVAPAPSTGGGQRWRVELVHGHGGCVGQPVFLEVRRETGVVRAAPPVVDRPVPQEARA